MSALLIALAAAGALTPPPLTPPLGTPFRYAVVDTYPGTSAATVRTGYTLAFARGGDGGLVAIETAISADVVAASEAKPGLDALLQPFLGIEVRVALDADGAPTALIDGERTVAAYHAALAALDATVAARTDLAPAQKAATRAGIAGEVAQPPSRLAEAASALLPPPVPPLRPGERRDFTTSIDAPGGGAIAAGGTVALVHSDPDQLGYRITVESAPGAGAESARRLRAAIPADLAEPARARIEAAAAALERARLSETTDFDIARATGLLIRLHSDRVLRDGDAPPRTIRDRAILLEKAPR